MVNQAVISLGSNIKREKNLPAAIRLMAKRCRIIAISSIYETTPIGLDEQPKFWNAAVLVETDLRPKELVEQVLAPIEVKLKRIRTTDKYASRTIDIDLTLFNDEIVDIDETHHIPDPDLLRFIHVAKPVADLIPKEKHPETGQSFIEIALQIEISMSKKDQESLTEVKGVDLGNLV